MEKIYYSNDWIQSKSKWTPYDNFTVKGMPILTIINGKLVMSDNELFLIQREEK